jgi:hypothetical protein
LDKVPLASLVAGEEKSPERSVFAKLVIMTFFPLREESAN